MTIQQTQLENGLTIVTDGSKEFETITMGAWVKAGSSHETISQCGMAHFLEHMAFKGTKTLSSLEISGKIESVGGYLNAHTAKEYTAYYGRGLAEHLPVITNIIGDIMCHSIFPKDEIIKERDVIIQEMGQSYDQPDDFVFDQLFEAAYDDQAFGRPILGHKKTISKFQQDDFKSFTKNHYTTHNMIIGAAGNVDHDDFVRLVQKEFNDLSQTQHQSPAQQEIMYTSGHKINRRELEQAHIVAAFESIPILSDDYYKSALLSTILGSGMSSRLFQEIREKRGLVYHVGAYQMPYKTTSLLSIYAGTGADKMDELMETLSNELSAVCMKINDEEFHRAKNQIKSSLAFERESVYARCERLAQNYMNYGQYRPHHVILDKINAITKQDIIDTAQKIFGGKPTISAVGDIAPDWAKEWKAVA